MLDFGLDFGDVGEFKFLAIVVLMVFKLVNLLMVVLGNCKFVVIFFFFWGGKVFNKIFRCSN